MLDLADDTVTKLEIQTCVDASLNSLSNIWNEIGIFGESRQSRKYVVHTHVKNLLREMIREEELLLDKLKKNVLNYKFEIQSVAKELHQIPELFDDTNKTLLQLERELKSKLDVLQSEKRLRMESWNSLLKQESKLSAELGSVKFQKDHINVPTSQEINILGEHVSKLNIEQSKRREEMKKTRTIIVDLLEKLELSPDSQFEEKLVNSVDDILVTTENISNALKYRNELMRVEEENKMLANQLWVRVRVLWKLVGVNQEHIQQFDRENSGYSKRILQELSNELNRCEEIKSKNLPLIIESARQQLAEIWAQCFVSEFKCEHFSPYNLVEISETLLNQLEVELHQMQRYYDDMAIPIELVSRHQKLWKEFLELETKTDNPDRFLNRGCNLLKEERTRRKIFVELPKIEKEVMDGIEAWQHETGRIFTLEDVYSFEEYVTRQKQLYAENKENEKLMRHQYKQKQIEDEMLFGSRPVTPTLKRNNVMHTYKSATNLNTPTTTTSNNKRLLPESPQPRKTSNSPSLKKKKVPTATLR